MTGDRDHPRRLEEGSGCGRDPAPLAGPRYCRLGLPAYGTLLNGTGEDAQATAAVGNTTANGSNAGVGQPTPLLQQGHRLAVLVPYRQREQHLRMLLAGLVPYLHDQGRAFDVFVIEQADALLFNRGTLLNAAALLLEGSAYDYYAFQVRPLPHATRCSPEHPSAVPCWIATTNRRHPPPCCVPAGC